MMFKKTRHRKREGRCFELSGEYALSNDNMILVHGSVRHVSGKQMAHAWIEDGKGNVYDLVKNEIYDTQRFYSIFNAKKIISYSKNELASKAAESCSWGPWNDAVKNIERG